MKSAAIIFYSVFFIVYTSLNYYIFARIGQASQPIKWLKIALTSVLVIGYLSFFVGMILERTDFQTISGILKTIGSFWLAYMLYVILSLVAIDILRLIYLLFGAYPGFITKNYETTKLVLLSAVFLFSTLMIIIGNQNASNTKIERLSIDIAKKSTKLKKLKILFASDIHLGSTIHKNDAQRLVEIAKAEKPDIILFGGDVLDSDVRPAISNNSGEPFKELSALIGVFAITGNHEYIGSDIEKATEYLESINIKLIRDTAIKVNDDFYIVGREDRDMKRFTSNGRKPLGDLMANINGDLPIIMMDHQPFKLYESAKMGVDLHLSGHTHNGQMWPLNHLVNAIFEKPWGYLKKGDTHFYISCGFGVWGPKVRIGSHSEVVIINVKFIGN